MSIRTYAVSLSVAALLASVGTAQPVLLTADAVIVPGQETIRSTAGGAPVPLATADITLQGAVLNVRGSHRVASLNLRNGAVVTHPLLETNVQGGTTVYGLAIAASGNVSIDGTSRIDASSKGFLALQGPGRGSNCGLGDGAGHGGAGGRSASRCDKGGATYDSIIDPAQFGSGAGSANGGGVIRLDIGGTLRVDLGGQIIAHGQSSTCGGAGGSIRVSAGALAGAGVIAANGGTAGYGRGGGGGGRVAVFAPDLTAFNQGTIAAYGGYADGGGGISGGAGTVFLKQGAARGIIRVDNSPRVNDARALTEFVGDVVMDADLEVAAGGLVGPRLETPGLHLNLLGNITVRANGGISAGGYGFSAGFGPGAGAGCGANGGGHGGRGGRAANRCATLPEPYGSVSAPTTLGSGAAPGGGRGGGALRVTTARTMTIETGGFIAANGEAGGGGGSGGSVWITARTITGGGVIVADGGPSSYGCGSGSGGRIALYCCDQRLPVANIHANAGGTDGGGGEAGQPGTRYFGSSSVVVTQQPEDVSAWAGNTATLSVRATRPGGAIASYQWRRRGNSGEMEPIVDDSRFTGSQTATLLVRDARCSDSGTFDCLITDSTCGAFPSDAAELVVSSRADFNGDSFVDFFDYSDFVTAFEGGPGDSDFNGDGFTDFFDYSDFVTAFEQGC